MAQSESEPSYVAEEAKRAMWAELRARKRWAPEERREPELRARKKRAAEERAFLRSPVGQARAAYDRGDRVFQCSINVMKQDAVILFMDGGDTLQKTTDPVAVLNAVCREGWELITGSFVFVERGQDRHNKSGTTMGYYLFRRAEDAPSDPPSGRGKNL